MSKIFEVSYAEGKSKLVDEVMEEMERQISLGDWTAIDELLRFVPRENLIDFLDDDKQVKHKVAKKPLLNRKPQKISRDLNNY